MVNFYDKYIVCDNNRNATLSDVAGKRIERIKPLITRNSEVV